jgi:hypothetical protein
MDNKLPFDIDNYHRVFKKYPKCLMESAGRVYGQFFIGNYYKRKEGYHGEYPPSFLERIYALFPNREKVLHLFSGTIKDEGRSTTVDINPEMNPSIVCNVTEVSQHIPPKSFPLVICDPPYSKKDAQIYGTTLVNKRLALREARKVTQDGGILVWLDTQVPIYRKLDWKLTGMIGIFCGTNRVIRVATIFQAEENFSEEQNQDEQSVEFGKQNKESNDSNQRGDQVIVSGNRRRSPRQQLSQTLKQSQLPRQVTV